MRRDELVDLAKMWRVRHGWPTTPELLESDIDYLESLGVIRIVEDKVYSGLPEDPAREELTSEAEPMSFAEVVYDRHKGKDRVRLYLAGMADYSYLEGKLAGAGSNFLVLDRRYGGPVTVNPTSICWVENSEEAT